MQQLASDTQLGGEEEPEREPEEDEDEEEVAPVAAKKKVRLVPRRHLTSQNKKKKKPKKKNTAAAALLDEADSPSSASTPKGKKGKGAAAPPDLDGMDEVDRALAELKLKYGDDPAPQPGSAQAEASAPRSALAFRNLLSVDPKNLDADAELRRFFGSKVVSGDIRVAG